MELNSRTATGSLFRSMARLTRAFIFRILSAGPIPNHFAFIMDGNRRFAMKQKLPLGDGHEAGALALIAMVKYLYELGVKYITVYAFSIDNFKRKPEQVYILMDLLMKKIQHLLQQESIVNVYGVKVVFIGNLKLLSEPVRIAAEKLSEATSKNTGAVLNICICYTSADEIVHGVKECCKEKEKMTDENEISGKNIEVEDVEKHLYMSVNPAPEILIRSSGEFRLSNFLLWQTTYSTLYNPAALWPEIRFFHVVWATLMYQRNYSYLDKKRKQI